MNEAFIADFNLQLVYHVGAAESHMGWCGRIRVMWVDAGYVRYVGLFKIRECERFKPLVLMWVDMGIDKGL